MKPILFVVYIFLKRTTKTVFGIFYAKSTLINKDFIKHDKATILVSNHPNTLFDPLNVASRVDTTVHFLANAGLLEAPVLGPFLKVFYCIPVERQKDVNGRGISNNKNFERCDEFLSGGGCLYIAPEGTSVVEHKLRPLKTGTARIALRAEAKNNFQLGLTILPFGLTYSAPSDFRSEVVVNVGQAIRVADYQSIFEEDNFLAARKITEDLQERLGDLIYNTADDEEEFFIKNIETLLRVEHPVGAKDQFFRTKEYIKLIRELKADDLDGYNKMIQNLRQYFNLKDSLKLNDKAIFKAQKGKRSWLDIFRLIIGFPFFLYGFINNFLAFYTPAFLAKKLNLYEGYTSTVKGIAGIFTLPLFYGLQIWLVQNWFENSTISILYAISLLPTGWISWEYLIFAKQHLKNIRALRLRKKGDKKLLNLLNLRKNLLESLTSVSSVVKL